MDFTRKLSHLAALAVNKSLKLLLAWNMEGAGAYYVQGIFLDFMHLSQGGISC
jgi:hypothetical protein